MSKFLSVLIAAIFATASSFAIAGADNSKSHDKHDAKHHAADSETNHGEKHDADHHDKETTSKDSKNTDKEKHDDAGKHTGQHKH